MIAAALALLLSGGQQVRSVDIYVTPYYSSAAKASKRVVRVDPALDQLLRSDRREDVLKARDLVIAEPARVSPIAMMVLAARLYDVGERDDAVFWFYAAKDRYMTLADVLVGFDRPGMFSGGAETRAAIGAFVQLAGPAINSYAFCNLDNQQSLRRQAYEWVATNPYQLLFDPARAAKSEDRQALLTASLERNRKGMEAETVQLSDEKFREELAAARAANKVDQAYCWRD